MFNGLQSISTKPFVDVNWQIPLLLAKKTSETKLQPSSLAGLRHRLRHYSLVTFLSGDC